MQLQDGRHLPTGVVTIAERPEWDFASARPLPRSWLNDAFEGWDGRAAIEQPDFGLTVEIAASGLPVLILYAPSPEAPFFCVEPVSHLVDELNAPDARQPPPLAHAESMTVAMTLATVPTEGRP